MNIPASKENIFLNDKYANNSRIINNVKIHESCD